MIGQYTHRDNPARGRALTIRCRRFAYKLSRASVVFVLWLGFRLLRRRSFLCTTLRRDATRHKLMKETYIRIKCQLQVDLTCKSFLVHQGVTFYALVNNGKSKKEHEVYSPSCSPLVSTVVRSTNASPTSSGSLASSAYTASLITFFVLNFAVDFLSGEDPFLAGGEGVRSAVRANSSSISSNTANRSSSSHSGCWPPRLIVFVRPFLPSNSTEQ